MNNQNYIQDIEDLKKIKDPFEKGKKIKSILQKYSNITYQKLAKKIGKTPSHLAHYVRLLKIPDIVVDGYFSGVISLSHLFVISRLKNDSDMIKIYEEVLKNNLTVKETEEKVRLILHNISSSSKEKYLKAEEINKIETLIKAFLEEDLYVKIKQTRIKTKIEIELKASLSSSNKFLKKLKEKLIKIIG